MDLEYGGFAEVYGIEREPNALQRSVAEELAAAVGEERGEGRRGGIRLVTATPGDGNSETAMETERVLAGGFGTRGLAFLLPAMATSDQMYLGVAGVVARQAGQAAGLTLTRRTNGCPALQRAGQDPSSSCSRVLREAAGLSVAGDLCGGDRHAAAVGFE
ncbi:hypothetical protein [Streptomyces sp. NPDC058457]|uniref:hypothetical protein n=1 Tax=Streptomyces sp. NPDC058457 TaxID=3346507 RepID=UPI003651A631